jgi:hypothetical protein
VLPTLKSLNIKNVAFVNHSNHYYRNIVTNRTVTYSNPSLERLVLINYAGPVKITCDSLKSLRLENQSFEGFFVPQKFKFLQELYLKDTGIQSDSLLHILRENRLERLILYSVNIRQNFINDSEWKQVELPKNPSLEVLHIYNCINLEVQLLIKIAMNAPNLKYFSFSEKLQDLSLQMVPFFFTNETLGEFLKHCPSLELLKLDDISSVNARVIQYFPPIPTLKELILVNLDVDEKSIRDLSNHFPNLISLSLRPK